VRTAIRTTLTVILALAAGWASVAVAASKLSPRHEEWLNGSVSLLVTKAERQAFEKLSTDDERDGYIDRFWELRNARPGSGVNEFRDEFYSRLEYANAFYGRDAGSEGWRTDRGRAYILFGKPRTSLSFLANQELYPTEMWFYANPGLAELPPFFYVLFVEKDGVSGYRMYNPVTDGPDKLMRSTQTKAQAYRYLRGLNSELAQATLTLIPGDMVDTESYAGSMASVVVLNAVQGYRDMPSYVRSISARSLRNGQVTSKLRYDIPQSRLLAFVALDQGEPWANWRLEIQDPLQPKIRDGRLEFQIRARLYSRGELVYERTDAPSFGVGEGQGEAVNKRPFVYEERFPVEPGEYRLDVSALNKASGRSYEASRSFSVAATGPGVVFTSDLLLAGRREPDSRPRPFQFGGARYTPLIAGHALPSRPLQVFYQVKGNGEVAAEWTAQYVIGSVAGNFRKTVEGKLDLTRSDSTGVVSASQSLPIDDLAPGAYQLALRLRNPKTGEVTGRSVGFVVVNQEEDQPILVARPAVAGPQSAAAAHYERALCWLAQERPAEALREAEASGRLMQTPAAKELVEQLRSRAGRASR
jgi:GWxTD domain-containing protein